MSMNDRISLLVAAALPHVVFDGWSAQTLAAAAADIGMPLSEARALCPRGGVDLAAAYHRQGDARMVEWLAAQDLSGLRFRDRIAAALRRRLEIADKEAVRRGMALFALPLHAAEGTRLVWGTADAVWRALGDTSDDYNWYTKRLTLSAVWSSTVLYWLGDGSENAEATWAFLDRRIEDVMRFEKFKASKPVQNLLTGKLSPVARLRAPSAGTRPDLPGRWQRGR
jgi:ubiquinone biosynthesis protein COQ9